MSVSFRRMDSFFVRDVRTTSEYSHMRYCYPDMNHEDILKKLLPIQRMCFVESEIRGVFVGSYTIPKICDGIYDIWLQNMRNVQRVSMKVVSKGKTTCTLYETEVHPSENTMQIPLSLPESQEPVQMCFQHFLRDGSINLSYLPILSLGRHQDIVIEINSGGKAEAILSSIHLANRNKWYLATHINRFYVGGTAYIVEGGKVKKYTESTKRPWWERVIPLFGLKVHEAR